MSGRAVLELGHSAIEALGRRTEARGHRAPGLLTRLDRVAPPLLLLLAGGWLLAAHGFHPKLPDVPAAGSGFFAWYDQGKYLQAALAWAAGKLDPSEHYYLPGYPWLGALFLRATPRDPFLVPDLVALVTAGWLFTALAARLLGGGAGARALAALIFLATTVGHPLLREVWVVPWTTTPATPLMYGCLLAGLRFAERPGAAPAFLCGLAGGGVAMFRPIDAALVLLAAGLLGLAGIARHAPGWRLALRAALAAAAGLALPVAAVAAGHLAVYGFARGGYLSVSADTGFEPALLPLRWVIIVLSPRPLLFTGLGLATEFWWLLPGLAGLVAMVLADRGRRAAHVAIGGAALAYLLLYLTYRDLHPTGLWYFQNYHYFKWLLPILAVYAILWLRAGWRPAWRRPALAGLAVTLLLVPWRAALAPDPAAPPPRVADGRLIVPGGLARLDDAVLVRVSSGFEPLYQQPHKLLIGGVAYRNFYDFRLLPRAGMGLLMPLRRLPPGEATLITVPEAPLDAAVPPSALRQGIRFGLPCFSARLEPACRTPDTTPASFPLGATLVAGEPNAEIWLVEGWGNPENGRWTVGNEAELLELVTGAPPGRDLALDVEARVFAPRRWGPPEVVVSANGAEVARWRWSDAEFGRRRAVIPHNLLGPGGALSLRFTIHSARSPAETGLGTDTRRLGLFLRTARLTAAAPQAGTE